MECAKGVCELKTMAKWAAICVLLAGALLLYHDPFLLLWWPLKPAEGSRALPLDMATESIDDMYDGCQSETASVIDLFGVFEWHYNRNFSSAWALAEKPAKKPVHTQLKEEHAVVMYMYTKIKYIQQYFNQEVKTGKHMYSTYRFKFHYFYFFLTDAIQLLRHNQTSCTTTYLRTQKVFDRNVINTNVRFGAFTLAASSKGSFAFNGDVSCFEIYSCFGADITYYSALKQLGQVLIPPYEVFKITHVLTNEPWCSVVYKLQSTTTPRTDLNCKLHQKDMKTYFGAILANWQKSSVGMMSVYIILIIFVSLILVAQGHKCFVAVVLGALLVLIIIQELANDQRRIMASTGTSQKF
ncbi:ecto-ADP-ribosyltransferase 4-like isoform X2 [Centropristis striata]|uniref:ecto-ADP-ribosyltransferase 4-like isoform X2 n=1 Tax=Centropristis striata TaxID=184440 RepID=UPI0027DF0091|nr:ecto-ADP-ribosyltransferase 4-like isoform X2 [Centropristis striata]